MNLIFDFGGVLLDLAPERCRANYHAIGYHAIDQMLSLAHQQGVLDRMERGLLTLGEYCDAIRDEISHADPKAVLPTDRQIAHAFCSMADGLPAERLDAIARLKRQGYRVSALSNTNLVHWGYYRRYFIEAGYVPEELFEHIWLSCEMHLVKPDPAIFARVLQESGYDPADTLFIDDNARNCEVAQTFGIHTFCPPIRTDWSAELDKILLTLNANVHK